MPENTADPKNQQTSVGVHHWSAYQSAQNFRKPEQFIPERWLGDEEFADDDRSALQAFSLGPRNCLGKVRRAALERCL